MSTRIDPNFKNTLKEFGKGNWNECYHCGNCTAVCPISEDGFLFPRKGVRAIQMGLKNKLASEVDPWLCYYCGECSETCPREANPGELMMTLRRYLTSVYDWTGLSGLFYKSLTALIIALVVVAAAIISIGFVKNFNTKSVMDFGHHFERIAVFVVIAVFLLPSIFRMFWYTIIKEKIKAPLRTYIKGFWLLIKHMFTQKNTLKCEQNTWRWLEHLLVVSGYILLLVTTVFLNWFSTDHSVIIYLGYFVSGLIFIFTFDFILQRFRKKKEISKFSHPTDWLFVIWLFFIGLFAFFTRLFIDTDLINQFLWLYVIHLIMLAQWALIIVPFGKWTHFLYRPFAILFAELKKEKI
jgi:quinone-modifying oxidoreductase subunit QmoC